MRIAPFILCATFASWVFAAGSADPSALRKLIEKRTQDARIASRSHTLGDEPFSGYRLRKRGPPQPKPVVVTKGGGSAPPPPPAKAQSVADTKALSQPVTNAKATAKGAACSRKFPRRSIYESLVARGEKDEECNSGVITLTLSTVLNGQTTGLATEVIPEGAKNLGVTSSGNLGVYEISKWDTQTGPFIAKRFKERGDMLKEGRILRLLDQLIAFSPQGSQESWIVMKVIPGMPLIGTREYAAAMAKSKPEANAFLKEKRQQLVSKVVEVYHKLGGKTHGDLYKKKEHALWDEEGQCNLIDWGCVADDKAILTILERLKKLDAQWKDLKIAKADSKDPGWQTKNVQTYAEVCALSLYPDRDS